MSAKLLSYKHKYYGWALTAMNWFNLD